MLRDIGAGVEMCRERCDYFSVCGGEPVNKLAENKTFASTETAYCRLTKMRATDLVLDALERAQPSQADRNGSGGLCVELPMRASHRRPAYVDNNRRFGETG
jgi:uncharacterized protein